eukprot:1047274-Pleurochrysis_carterae.AAC.1
MRVAAIATIVRRSRSKKVINGSRGQNAKLSDSIAISLGYRDTTNCAIGFGPRKIALGPPKWVYPRHLNSYKSCWKGTGASPRNPIGHIRLAAIFYVAPVATDDGDHDLCGAPRHIMVVALEVVVSATHCGSCS